MKRKLLEITEIDCGDETCDGCGYCNNEGSPPRCQLFWVPYSQALDGKKWLRPPRITECLGAERKFGDANGPGDEVGRFLNFSMRGGVK